MRSIALSDLGKHGYLSFWSSTIARYILSLPTRKATSVKDISENTFILPDDIIAALREMNVMRSKALVEGTASVNKANVRDWAMKNRVNLEPVVEPDNFLEGATTGSDSRSVF